MPSPLGELRVASTPCGAMARHWKGWRVAGKRVVWLALVVWLSSLGSTATRLAWSDEMRSPEAVDQGSPAWDSCNPDGAPATDTSWTLQVMPVGLLYRSYLAGAKEPRFASFWNTDSDQGDLWDAALPPIKKKK